MIIFKYVLSIIVMEIDKKTIKALSADTRVTILKSLNERRKLPSELSRELNIAPSTVVEHLKILESAELVRKQKRGSKWIYYELTVKGSGVVKPKINMQFVLILSLGIIVIFGSMINIANITQIASKTTEGALATAETASDSLITGNVGINWIAIITMIIGIIIVIYALIKMIKK